MFLPLFFGLSPSSGMALVSFFVCVFVWFCCREGNRQHGFLIFLRCCLLFLLFAGGSVCPFFGFGALLSEHCFYSVFCFISVSFLVIPRLGWVPQAGAGGAKYM